MIIREEKQPKALQSKVSGVISTGIKVPAYLKNRMEILLRTSWEFIKSALFQELARPSIDMLRLILSLIMIILPLQPGIYIFIEVLITVSYKYLSRS